MKILLIVILVVGAVATQAAIMTAAEQYRVLKTTKQTEDANAERQFKESISVIEADRDLSIYKGYEVRNAIALMFADSTMRSNAETFVRYQPPIHDLGNASAVNLAAGSGSISSGTPTAQAIAQTSAPTQSNLLSGG